MQHWELMLKTELLQGEKLISFCGVG